MQPVYLNKALNAASSNGIGSVSTAVPSVVTVNTSLLDTGRRIVFTSTGDASTLTLTFVGKIEGGQTLTEAVKGSTATGINATTVSDFVSITTISISSNANIPILVGTSSVGGTPWKVCDYFAPSVPSLAGGIVFTTSANSMTGSIEMTMDDPTLVTTISTKQVPSVFVSTSHISTPCSTTSFGFVNNDGNTVMPIAAYRLTLTSSSSQAGSINAVILQSGD